MSDREYYAQYRLRNREKIRERQKLWARKKNGFGLPRKPVTEQTRLNISLAKRGKSPSLEHRLAISRTLKGKPRAWRATPEQRKRLSEALKVWFAANHRTLSLETRKKIGLAHRGSRNVNWKGGISPNSELARKTVQYRDWRRTVFRRDGYRCRACGAKGQKLNADHIYPFAKYPRLRLEIYNGQTLCEVCHKLKHSLALCPQSF